MSARLFPEKPTTESTRLVCGEVRYTHNGQRMIVLSGGWSDNSNGYLLSMGNDFAVAADCGWIWEPRVVKGSDLLTPAEYADYALTLAAHYEHHAAYRREQATQDEAKAAALHRTADSLLALGGVLVGVPVVSRLHEETVLTVEGK